MHNFCASAHFSPECTHTRTKNPHELGKIQTGDITRNSISSRSLSNSPGPHKHTHLCRNSPSLNTQRETRNIQRSGTEFLAPGVLCSRGFALSGAHMRALIYELGRARARA